MPKTKAKKPVKRTPILTPEPAATGDEPRQTFDSGAVRSALDIRYDLLSGPAVEAYRSAPVEIVRPEEIVFRLMGSLVSDWQFASCLGSIGALIHLERTGELPDMPSRHAITAYAEAMTEGSAKYGDENWLKGIPESNLVQHAVNHLFQYAAGDRSEDHLAHAFWNVASVIHFREIKRHAETNKAASETEAG